MRITHILGPAHLCSMASSNRSAASSAAGASSKMQPRKGKDGFVADNVFAVSGAVPDDVRAGVEAFDTLDSKSFRRCLQIAIRIASGDAVDSRLLTETGFVSFVSALSPSHYMRFLCCSPRVVVTIV
jgi:hypothetical protein